MEFRQLRYFLAVAEGLNFHRAADHLHVGQSAVSEQIRQLEAELGVRLFNRGQGGVTLTDAGVALFGEARLVLHRAEVAQHAARSARDQATSSLRIGYVPTSLPGSVPRALGCLSRSMPNLNAALEPGNGFDLIQGVRANELDAAVVSLPAPTMTLSVTRLCDQSAVAVLPLGHQQAMRPGIRLDQVAPERILVLPREANRPLYDSVVAACHRAEISPRLIEIPDASVERILLTIASGGDMALLPDSVSERYSPIGVRFVPLHGDVPRFGAAIVTRRETSRGLVTTFLREVTRAEQRHGIENSSAPALAVA
jgi:DNA-binding transcriptional LysR family regulator